MSKSKLAIILDNFFIALTIFVIAFIWLHKYIKNAILDILLCIFISTFAFFLLFYHSMKKYNLLFFKNKELKFADKCFKSLMFSDSRTTTEFFETLLNAKAISKNIYKNEKSFFYVNVKSILTNVDFINANEFYLDQSSDLPLCFLCESYDSSFYEILMKSTIQYNVFKSNDIFLLMKNKNFYPISTAEKNEKFAKLKSAKNKVLSTLNRKQFKNFFLSGLSLIIISIFLPFTSYYSIFGTILLILSIVCLLRKAPMAENNTKLSDFLTNEIENSSENLENEKNKNG